MKTKQTPRSIACLASSLLLLSGCAGVVVPEPSTQLSWDTSNSLTITATRSGCEFGDFKVKNSGENAVKVSGTLDILDAQSNLVTTARFYCENAYPGGSSGCRSSLRYVGNVNKYPGYFCKNAYAQYKMTVR